MSLFGRRVWPLIQQLRPIHGPTQKGNIIQKVPSFCLHILKPRHALRSPGNSGIDSVFTEGSSSSGEQTGQPLLGPIRLPQGDKRDVWAIGRSLAVCLRPALSSGGDCLVHNSIFTAPGVQCPLLGLACTQTGWAPHRVCHLGSSGRILGLGRQARAPACGSSQG